jgi:hypothetical protein
MFILLSSCKCPYVWNRFSAVNPTVRNAVKGPFLHGNDGSLMACLVLGDRTGIKQNF